MASNERRNDDCLVGDERLTNIASAT